MKTEPLGTSRHAALDGPAFQPLRVLEIEIGNRLPDIERAEAAPGQPYERALVLVRLHTQPLGALELPLEQGSLSASACATAIWHSLAAEIRAHLLQDGLPAPLSLEAAGLPSAQIPTCLLARQALLADAPFVSVVVGTRDRPDSLATCLRSLLKLDYPRFEIIVVDNASTSRATAEVVRELGGEQASLRYVREDRPGLSWARNRGLHEAHGEIVAFTDDDAVADRYWLTELVRGFAAADRVGCVTGLVFPLELETQAQLWFEQFGGFNKGYTQRIFDLGAHRVRNRLYPYSAGIFGGGVNMAYRTATLRALGGFDPALGTGTPALGGEDLAAFFQIITSGNTLVYAPSAIVHHMHRRDYAGLQKTMYDYGVGLTAYLMKCIIEKPIRLLAVPAWIPTALAFGISAQSKKDAWRPVGFPLELNKFERKGMVDGPIRYIRSRRQRRRVSQAHFSLGSVGLTAESPRASIEQQKL